MIGPPAHIIKGLARIWDIGGDRDDVEQLALGRLQVRQRVVGRVHLAPHGGVNNLLGGVQTEVGGVRGEEAVGDAGVVDQDVNWERKGFRC